MSNLFRPTEEHEQLRAAVRDLVDAKIAPRAAAIDETAEFPWDVHQALVAAELHAVHVPEAYGGPGADAVAVCIVIEEIARACVSSSLIPAVNKLGTTGLLLAGSEELKLRYLEPLARGDVMFSYALSEGESGSDAASMRSSAVRDGDDWVLNGSKRWITNAGVSTYYTVMAVTDPAARSRGISMFVVHADDEGFTLGAPEKKMGIKGSPTRELFFDNVRLSHERLVGEPGSGFSTALAALDQTRPTIAAQAVGVAQGALDFAVAYVKERRQFGKAVAEFQGLQFMLADMASTLDAARLMTYAAAEKAERRDADATYFSAAAKAFASDAAMRITTDAVQLLGGYGYVKDFPVERMMRDAKITQIYEGTNQIQRVVMARHLLK